MKHACFLLLCFLIASCNQKTANTEPEKTEKEQKKLTSETWEPELPELVTGKEIYLQECALCHDHGEEGAPKLTNIKRWESRLTQSEEVIIKKAIEGFIGDDGEMPARGGTPSLTDEEVAAAVRFMIAFPREPQTKS